MDHAGLKARMVLAGTIVFAFYAAFALVLRGAGVGLPVVLAASVVFVIAQYKLGTWLALRGAGADDLPESEYPRWIDGVVARRYTGPSRSSPGRWASRSPG